MTKRLYQFDKRYGDKPQQPTEEPTEEREVQLTTRALAIWLAIVTSPIWIPAIMEIDILLRA